MPTRSRRRRIAVGAGVLAVIAGTTVGIVSAFDEPQPTAGQLLSLVDTAEVIGLSGTVVHHADLGAPGFDDSRNMRVWYSAPDRVRLAILDADGETDVIRNGDDVWVWDSRADVASHYLLPETVSTVPLWPPTEVSAFVASPVEAARDALATLSPSTMVAVDGTTTVAGRLAHELVIVPRDASTLIASIRLSVDAETGVPLRTRVWAHDGDIGPELEIAFSRIVFGEPDAANFDFLAPAGVVIDDVEWSWGRPLSPPDTIGSGWTTIVSFRLSEPIEAGVLESVGSRRVDGAWGSGRVLTSPLLSMLVTDDGRVFAGAVEPDRLVEAAAQ